MIERIKKFFHVVMVERIKKFFHDHLGWHDGKGPMWFDGASLHSVCSQCGENVMQDGQGNWF